MSDADGADTELYMPQIKISTLEALEDRKAPSRQRWLRKFFTIHSRSGINSF